MLYNCGAAFVFVNSAGAWSQQAYLKAPNTGSNLYLGAAVALYGDDALVTEPGDGSTSVGVDGSTMFADSNVGAAFLFSRSGTSPF